MKKSHLNINIMCTAYCPHCRAVTNLSVSMTLRTITAPGGTTETLISRTYHCESCRSFVRSEDDCHFPQGVGKATFQDLLLKSKSSLMLIADR